MNPATMEHRGATPTVPARFGYPQRGSLDARASVELHDMEEAEVKNLVKEWRQRSVREGDILPKFVFLWFSFNAWLAYESGEDRDHDMIELLANALPADSELRASYNVALGSEVFRTYLKNLAGLSPIHSTGRRVRQVQIDSAEDFAGIVRGLYQVRCNLFHGGKRPGDVRDQKLVKTCSRILEKWVGNLVGSWR